ncbi:hypothetical protein OEZ86_006119 [Tetradesmus obliquus]|nr:hypothetical protein OEZ86_006119 [Tetradesmus obliquus]
MQSRTCTFALLFVAFVAVSQQQAVAALQAVGIQVNGRFGIQASVRMTARQAASKAVQDNCCYTVRSMAAHG